MKLIKHDEPYELNVKRLELPYTIQLPCKCGYLNIIDLRLGDWINYPTFNQVIPFSNCCRECGKDFEFKIRLEIKLTLER